MDLLAPLGQAHMAQAALCTHRQGAPSPSLHGCYSRNGVRNIRAALHQILTRIPATVLKNSHIYKMCKSVKEMCGFVKFLCVLFCVVLKKRSHVTNTFWTCVCGRGTSLRSQRLPSSLPSRCTWQIAKWVTAQRIITEANFCQFGNGPGASRGGQAAQSTFCSWWTGAQSSAPR